MGPEEPPEETYPDSWGNTNLAIISIGPALQGVNRAPLAVPGEAELAVIRTREEMGYRERVAVQKAILRQKLEREEAERWRQTAAKVAIAAVPIVGRAAGRGLFNAALRLRGGCVGSGCLALFVLLLAALGFFFL